MWDSQSESKLFEINKREAYTGQLVAEKQSDAGQAGGGPEHHGHVLPGDRQEQVDDLKDVNLLWEQLLTLLNSGLLKKALYYRRGTKGIMTHAKGH